MKKYVEVQAVKEFALGFLPDPILRMAVNAVLDNAPAVDLCPKWTPVSEGLPPMTDVFCDDPVEPFGYLISDPVLAFTSDGNLDVVKVTKGDTGVYWITDDGAELDVMYWMSIPVDSPLNKIVNPVCFEEE